MPLTRSLLYRICPRGGALATMSTTARIPAVVGGAEAGRGVRAARRARGALRTSTPSTGGARRMPCGGAERGAAHCASTVSPRSPRPAPHGGTSWTPSVQLRYRPGGPANFQRSGAVGACRAHNPEAVGSKPTFATGSSWGSLSTTTIFVFASHHFICQQLLPVRRVFLHRHGALWPLEGVYTGTGTPPLFVFASHHFVYTGTALRLFCFCLPSLHFCQQLLPCAEFSFTGIQTRHVRDPRCPVDSLLLSKTPRLTSPERSRLRIRINSSSSSSSSDR